MELELLEKFAAGEDREAVLSHLVPGTDDFFFYSTLHALNTGSMKKAKNLIAEWKSVNPYHPKLSELENRFHLLEFADKKDKASLAFLTDKLQIDTSHGRQGPGQEFAPATFASILDPQLVDTKEQVVKALQEYSWGLGPFSEQGLEHLATLHHTSLNADQRKDLLNRIQRPDINNLVALVAADLERSETQVRRFGDCSAHRLLTHDQLKDLVKVLPRVATETTFVELYLQKLVPHGEVNWETDTEVVVEYFTKARAFVDTLPSAFNNLKASTLLLQLDFESRRLSKYCYDDFIAYLAIPKYQPSANPAYVNAPEQRNHIANISSLPGASFLRQISQDTELVEDFLTFFFRQGSQIKDFELYVESGLLKRVFATVALTNTPKPDKVRDDLIKVIGGPAAVEELRNRAEIAFTRFNKTLFRADEEVELDVLLKNIPKLTIKVFEINTFNYYKDFKREVPSDINLDGLVANLETQLTYDHVPMYRHMEKLSFPQLRKPGVFVMELLGGGLSSRAVIRKGRLLLSQRTSVAGHMVQITDESNVLVRDAYVWMDGQAYTYPTDGSSDEILIPFRPNSPSPSQPILLCSKSLTTLTTFNHTSESYTLTAGMYVDRESLLAGNHRAQVIVRPSLLLNNMPVTTAILKNVAFNIELVDSTGVSTTKKEEDIALEDGWELVRTFAVPENTRRVVFTLTAGVSVISAGGRTDEKTCTETYEINGIDDTDRLEDVHLQYARDGSYELKVLGRTGEPKANRVVNVAIHHRFFADQSRITADLQSNEAGIVHLGPLKNVLAVTASLSGETHSWTLVQDACTLPSVMQQRVGTPIKVPFMGDTSLPINRRQASLLQVSENGEFVSDCFSHLSIEAPTGLLVVDGKLMPGSYVLTIKENGCAGTQKVSIRITRGLPVRRREDAPVEAITCELARTKNPYANNLIWQCDRCFVHGSGDVYHCPTKEYDLCVACYNTLTGVPTPPVRTLELSAPQLMQVASLLIANDELIVKVANATPDTRVHVFCPRLVHDYTLLAKFSGTLAAAPLGYTTYTHQQSSYSSGRRLGDEQLYVMARKEGKQRPGNMLPRPSLLLNPVEIRSTETKRQDARLGENMEFFGGPMAAACAAPYMNDMCARSFDGGMMSAHSTNIDWLATPLVFACNLVPSPDGTIRVPLASIGALAGGNIVVYATNEEQAVVRTLRAPAKVDAVPRDLRMLKPLPASAHFTEQRRAVSVKDAASSWTTDDVATTTFTLYDTLGKVYGLLSTLLQKDKEEFARFSFLPRWGRLAAEEKRRLYSEYACHELNFFLYRKDAEFFAAVVRPYLANKCQKTLVDRLLLGESLENDSEVSKFNELNVFEQVLLALGNRSIAQHISENLRDRAASKPIDIDRANFLFDTALKAAALDESESGGGGFDADFGDAMESAPRMMAEERSFAFAAPMAMSMAAPPPPMARMARSAPAPGGAMMMMKRAKATDMSMRESAAASQMYRAPDKTKELGDRNYWQQKGEPIRPSFGPGVSGFWADVAAWAVNPADKCASARFVEACSSANEALLVLAFLDVPFQNDVQLAYEERSLTMASKEPFIVFSKQIQAAAVDDKQAILVHENFFDVNDAYVTRRDGQQEDKFLKDEALVFTVYGCRVVLTNVSSATQKLNLLIQVPEGAIPVRGSLPTRSLQRQVGAYSTLVEEYHFYFPQPGRFRHFPAHVAREGVVCGWAHDYEFRVVSALSSIDATSWVHVASASDPSQALAFLAEQNLTGVDLGAFCWQLRTKRVFEQTVETLRARRVYSSDVWGYGFMHGDEASVREYLYNHRSLFGPCVSCTLLTVPPEETYTHTEFDPVINARAHRMGEGRVILNDRIKAQYETLLRCLSYLPTVPRSLLPAVVYHLLLQDRIEEGAALLAKHGAAEGGESGAEGDTVGLQLDYLRAYMDFFSNSTELPVARRICAKYENHPVARWKKLFGEIRSQLAEIDTGVVAEATEENTASRQPSLSFVVEGGKIRARSQNLAGKTLNIRYFAVDIELLFSSTPFVSQSSGQQFLYVKPNFAATAIIPESGGLDIVFEEKYSNSNVVVELSAEGVHTSQPVFSNSLNVQTFESYGQVLVTSSNGRPVVGAYVKTFAKYRDGRVAFYKDGYCDLRGRFDYVSLTTKEENIQRFSILVVSDKFGSVIKEASPPSVMN